MFLRMAAFKGGVLTTHCSLMVPSLSALGLGVQHGPEYWWGGELSISGCLSSGPSQLEGIMGNGLWWPTEKDWALPTLQSHRVQM